MKKETVRPLSVGFSPKVIRSLNSYARYLSINIPPGQIKTFSRSQVINEIVKEKLEKAGFYEHA